MYAIYNVSINDLKQLSYGRGVKPIWIVSKLFKNGIKLTTFEGLKCSVGLEIN